MKTIKTQTIDGYRVITGIYDGAGFIDPVATKKIVDVEITKSETYREIERLKSNALGLAVQAKQAQRNARTAKTDAERRQFWSEYQNRHDDIDAIQAQLLPLATTLKKEISALTLEHARYFNLPPDEEYRDDAEAQAIADAMTTALDNGAVLALAGNEIVEVKDRRGKRYYQKTGEKWTASDITALGIEPAATAIAEADLSESQRSEIAEQFEAERIAKLKTTDKVAEKTAVLDALAGQAQAMKGKLEIMGDAEALAKAMAWYDTESAKTEAKYA